MKYKNVCVKILAVLAGLAIAGIHACQDSPDPFSTKSGSSKLYDGFSLLPSTETGIDFSNTLKEDYNYNIFSYEYLYNGCGVGAGDVNGDGLPDLYFASAFGKNKLYLNQGNFQFKEVAALAGVEATDGYKTGVALADINGDGKLDIHCCRTSKTDDGKKTDFVYINGGNQTIDGLQVPQFTEQASALGLTDNSNTNHVCYFDFDRDGDLDVFYLNHRVDFADATRIRAQQNEDGTISRIRTPATLFESNRLYRNDGATFTDITSQAGLVSAAFGLSVVSRDINQDGWPDLYVANDYIEPDYLYINNGDGTFTDRREAYLKHTSQNSMGSDMADINNDGLPDLIVLDMKAEDHIRYKELANVMQDDRYNLLVQYGYGRQQGRNMLQLNNGNNTFSEVGQFSGMSSTDWSWAPLLADFNNDGWRDLYITNGYRKDVTNLDYMNFFRDSIAKTGGLSSKRFPDIEEFIQYIPDQKISNYMFVNSGHLSFDNVTEEMHLSHPAFSTGAAYADFDLDGDLDIVVSNINDPAFVYRNDLHESHWIQITAEDHTRNPQGLGATVTLFAGLTQSTDGIRTNKGFLSTSEAIVHFGLGENDKIDSLLITWPDGGVEMLLSPTVDQRLVWKRGMGEKRIVTGSDFPPALFVSDHQRIQWQHEEMHYNDFKREKLLPYMLSAEGPCLAIGDVNGDDLEDVYAGNGAGFVSRIFIQNDSGRFVPLSNQSFEADKGFEDTDAVMVDVDHDGDLDLMVASGGNALPPGDRLYAIRLYRNDGDGQFIRDHHFPDIRANVGAIHVVDYDDDGDMDLVIGARNIPGRFPEIPESYLLENKNGQFTISTDSLFPDIRRLGMVADIESGDLDGDGFPEIVVAGEWMPVSIYSFDGKTIKDRTAAFGLDKLHGWWKSIAIEDIDADGDLDVIAGNIGLNHRMKASLETPVTLIANDFDRNGSLDPIMNYYAEGDLYPYPGRDAIIAQLPILKKQFTRYAPYARARTDEIFTPDQIQNSQQLYAHTFETMLFINEEGLFQQQPLPFPTQLSPVMAILVADVNADGKKDILMGGNYSYFETETGEMDAGNGTLLLQQQDGSFRWEPNRHHGFWAQQEVREIHEIQLAGGQKAILTGNNKGYIELHLLQIQ